MDERKETLILGLGNTIMTDDGVGVIVARRARALAGDAPVEVAEAEIAGFALLELIAGRQRVVVVDAVTGGGAPGDILVSDLGSFRPTSRLAAGHEIDLPTAVELGRQLGLRMPREIHVVAVVVEDATTLGEALTPAVERAVTPAAMRALELARGPLDA